MPKFKERLCGLQDCTNSFVPSGPASKFCDNCALERRRLSSCTRTANYRVRNNLIKKPGVGKGGNNAKGIEDSQYSTGIASFQTIKRSTLKEKISECQRCHTDLSNAGRYEWCVHHIDHSRSNNDYSNLELLCKRCHQIEHECHKAFESAETIEKAS